MVVFKSLKKTVTYLQKVQGGKRTEELDDLVAAKNGDISQFDVDEDYLKEMMSYQKKSESVKDSETASVNRRDQSVPVSRSSNYERFRYHEQNRNKSTIRPSKVGNYYQFKQNSKYLDMTTVNPSEDNLPQLQSHHEIPGSSRIKFNVRKTSDDEKSLVPLSRKGRLIRSKDKMSEISVHSPFPIKTKKMELFPN